MTCLKKQILGVFFVYGDAVSEIVPSLLPVNSPSLLQLVLCVEGVQAIRFQLLCDASRQLEACREAVQRDLILHPILCIQQTKQALSLRRIQRCLQFQMQLFDFLLQLAMPDTLKGETDIMPFGQTAPGLVVP